jgi:mono/diheme cytochrome c family protein
MHPTFSRPILKKLTAGALALASVLAMLSPANVLATNWLTYHFDNSRDGANTNEVVLTPANVNTNAFFRLFTYTVDAEVYAEPLYMANVAITGQGTHNVLFVATENDTVYAFDADSNLGTNGGLLWKTNLGIAVTSSLFGTRYYHNVLNPLFGITGTPVIDPVAGTIYVDALTCSAPDTTNVFHHLHALNIADGTERPNSPVLVTGSVPGTGVDNVNGSVTFNATNNDSRPALTLAGGIVYVSFSSFGDTDPFHGWVIGFNAVTLQQVTNYVFVTTPNATIAAFGVNAGEASIWMGGNGLCVDTNNNLYFETGNGSFSANTNGGDYGDSFVKLSTAAGFTVADYFTPSNQLSMAANDLDLGSGGPILLPDAVGSAAHPHLMVGAGKEGTLYLVDRDNMGHYSPTTNNIVQTAQTVVAGTWGTPAYFNYRIYNQSEGDTMKAFSISNGVMSASPVSQSTVSIGGTGYAPTISANGTSNAIAWVIDAGAFSSGANNNSSDTSSGPSILRAFNATNLSQQLYNSSIKTSDNAPGAVKYPVATIADGKVFVGGDYGVAVYGLGVILPLPIISPNGGVYTNSVTVSLSDASNNVEIYYTLNGTIPTTNSLLYTGPFTLTNTVEVNAIAAQAGSFNSVVASASFVNSSSIGTGTGLQGSYWSNTTSTAFTNVTFTNLPTLVRTDATVNFNFGSAGPAASVGKSNYAVRWVGSVQPQFSEPYTFYTTADDGVLLYVNGQLLINDWVNQAATLETNTITLEAQQLYNIELYYYYGNDNGGQVSLEWSSSSTPQAVIPQSQLYPYTNPPPTIVLSAPAGGSIYTATASVSIGAIADAPYNPISQVAFYANGSLLGAMSGSPTAPLYSMTMPGFGPNAGGQTANSIQISAQPSAIVTLTTTTTEASGTDWTAAIWKTNGTGTAVAAVAGNAYATLSDGTSIGNSLNNTRIRSPAVSGTETFAGNSLTLNTNTELRTKGTPPTTLNFPGAGGNPGLVLNGGMLNNGDSTTPGNLTTITGSIQIASQSYNSAQGENGGGGGLAPNYRSFNIAGYLSGPGNLVIMNCSTNAPQVVSCPTNTYSGEWIVQCGWLQATNANSLGTSSSVLVNPEYTGYLATMPNASSPVGPAIFEVDYPLDSTGTLTLVNGGMMNLLQNCTFSAVTIEGTPLNPGTYSYAQLSASFPNNFLPGGSGSITVAVPTGPPGPTPVPSGLAVTTGNAQVNLFWNASLGATNYNVKRSTTSGGPYTTLATVPGTSYTDTAVVNGTTYYYVVSALSAPGYTLTVVATDGSGLSSTSAPVQITINAGSGLPYGMTTNGTVPAFFNMPTTMPASLPGSLPLLLSETGVYANTPNRTPAGGLIPYVPNTPLWSDGAQKSRYMAVPNSGGVITPAAQIAFAPTNPWTFPAGTVFVKNFDLAVNTTNPGVPLQRLETRLLVRNINGGVYGVTYKWRPDNSDADLLTTSSNQTILVTNATGVTNQTWYYPSPVDCLTCHTAVANYVLGLKTGQLNCTNTYPATGVSDNQLRTLNRLGLFYPAINEASISNLDQFAALTNLSAPLVQRTRSYLDANCAQCHQPGGAGITFDARYDTPLAQQNIVNYPAQLPLGIDNPCIIAADDVWRSMIMVRINVVNPASQMPPLARNVIDTNAVQVITAWINSLPGTPALAPPTITPNGGTFSPSVTVTLQGPDTNAAVYYTLNGTLPTTNSFLYSAPLLLTNSLTLSANAFEASFTNSVAASAPFTVLPGVTFTAASFGANHQFQVGVAGIAGDTYVLEGSTNLINWTPLGTNVAPANDFNLYDTNAVNYPYRFYRVVQE